MSTDVVTVRTPDTEASTKRSLKEVIRQVAAEQGHTGSYAALLYLMALTSVGPDLPAPKSAEERANWQGHRNGLRSALVCLAMHERQLSPKEAAVVVIDQLAQACAAVENFSGRPLSD